MQFDDVGLVCSSVIFDVLEACRSTPHPDPASASWESRSKLDKHRDGVQGVIARA